MNRLSMEKKRIFEQNHDRVENLELKLEEQKLMVREEVIGLKFMFLWVFSQKFIRRRVNANLAQQRWLLKVCF